MAFRGRAMHAPTGVAIHRWFVQSRLFYTATVLRGSGLRFVRL